LKKIQNQRVGGHDYFKDLKEPLVFMKEQAKNQQFFGFWKTIREP
jgi:hypothetical protein